MLVLNSFLSNIMSGSFKFTIFRNKNYSADQIAERYRLNHAIVVQAARQALVCGTLCLQAACLQNTPQMSNTRPII